MTTFGNLFLAPKVQHNFGVPVYSHVITGDVLDTIQQDFKKIYDEYIATDKFRHNSASKSHMLSDITFSSNFLDELDVTSFKKELDIHIKEYLKLTDSDVGITRPSDYRITGSWMALNKENSYAVVHSHGDTDISGVYYFKTNGQDGNLFFETANKLTKSSYCFRNYGNVWEQQPEVGKLLLFPGWLEHGVGTNHTNNDRVSISFNIHFTR